METRWRELQHSLHIHEERPHREINTFLAAIGEPAALAGSIDDTGKAILSIDLNDVSTEIDIRNERMANFVFETEFLPNAFITVNVDTGAWRTWRQGQAPLTPYKATSACMVLVRTSLQRS